MNHNRKFKELLLFAVVMVTASTLQAQEDMDFYSNIGKIYVVVGVIMLVFIGLIIFLVRLEKRIKKLEQETTKN